MKTLTIGGLFSGIGAHASACERLASDEIAFKVAFQCEFDEKTAKAYDMIHGQTPNLGDITKVKDLNNHPVDILFHTPPCQDISQANRQRAGCEEGSGTRSALMFEVVRILKATDRDKLPKYLVMEEVSTLAGKYKPFLDDLLGQLSDLGYSHNYANMNAKDYGIPQNRRRLMGYTDAEFDSVKGAFCMTQLYKFAGNSVCVCVFQAVLKQIIEDVKQ